jgi:hypothetical protein
MELANMLTIIPIMPSRPNKKVIPKVIITSQITGRKQNGIKGIILSFPNPLWLSHRRNRFCRDQCISATIKVVVRIADIIAMTIIPNIFSSLFVQEFI